jgi:hypothetical protein
MAKFIEEVKDGINYKWNKYDPQEMPNYWLKNDRYIADAKLMDSGCVVIKCTEDQAKEIASYFVNNIFAIPTCTFYDGSKLSLCVDYAGRNSGLLRHKTEKYIYEHLNYKK